MSEDKVGPRGKRILYSKFLSGGIHKDDYNQVEEFKQNCSRKGIHMNYDGKKKRCAWSILLKRNNKIEDVLIPFALASGVDADRPGPRRVGQGRRRDRHQGLRARPRARQRLPRDCGLSG